MSKKRSITPNNLYKKINELNKNQNSNKTFFPLISNSTNETHIDNNNNSYHPLQFYALGKTEKNEIHSYLKYNNAFKSKSNNIIERNALSINTTKFNKINIHKINTNISEQNISQNNYLKPVEIFKTFDKYRIPETATNFTVYHIMKEKFFSKDVENNISKGKIISNEEFIKEKKNINKKEETKGNYEIDISKDKKSNTSNGFFYKDPNDSNKKLLINNNYYFEQNDIQMIKPKKWKIEAKS